MRIVKLSCEKYFQTDQDEKELLKKKEEVENKCPDWKVDISGVHSFY